MSFLIPWINSIFKKIRDKWPLRSLKTLFLVTVQSFLLMFLLVSAIALSNKNVNVVKQRWEVERDTKFLERTRCSWRGTLRWGEISI